MVPGIFFVVLTTIPIRPADLNGWLQLFAECLADVDDGTRRYVFSKSVDGFVCRTGWDHGASLGTVLPSRSVPPLRQSVPPTCRDSLGILGGGREPSRANRVVVVGF